MITTLKKIFSGTKQPMTLKVGMLHRIFKYYQVCSNDDLGLTLTYFTAKLVDSFNSMSTWTFMNIKGQGHSLTFVQGHSDSTFSNFFCSESARPIEAIQLSYGASMWCEEWKFVQMFKVTWPWPYMVKNVKNFLLRNQETDDLETWYTALGTRVLPMFSYDDHGLTLTIFMIGSNLFPNASAWAKAYTALSALVFPK